jgi:hypothetical protein
MIIIISSIILVLYIILTLILNPLRSGLAVFHFQETRKQYANGRPKNTKIYPIWIIKWKKLPSPSGPQQLSQGS